jgi:hypothetical protein
MKFKLYYGLFFLLLLSIAPLGCKEESKYLPGTAQAVLPSVSKVIEKAESAKAASEKLDGEAGIYVRTALDQVIEEAYELKKSTQDTAKHVLALEARVADLEETVKQLQLNVSDAKWLKWSQRVSLVAVAALLGAGVIFRSGAIASVAVIPGISWVLSYFLTMITPLLPLIIGISLAAAGVIVAIRYRSYLMKTILSIEHVKPAIPELEDLRLFGKAGKSGEIGEIQGPDLTKFIRVTKAKLRSKV